MAILFSGPMVQALLEGRKTQTRRLIKPQPALGYIVKSDNPFEWGDEEGEYIFKLPYDIGTRLWVREAWRVERGLDHLTGKQIESEKVEDPLLDRCKEPIFFEANEEWLRLRNGTVAGRYRHARYMPRWASRLTLTVTKVRVQRLQDITEEDALAEGILECEDDGWGICYSGTHWTYPVPAKHMRHYPREAFWDLWDGLNAKRGFGWAENPWVAAYTFTVHRGNIDDG